MAAVEVKALPGRGRGLVTARNVAAGEVVLAEEPLLLTVSPEAKDHACANCLCWLQQSQGAVKCCVCNQVAFCSAKCQQQAAARPWVHADATCRAYSLIPQLFPTDIEGQGNLRFLVQAAALRQMAAMAAGQDAVNQQQTGYAVLMSLVGEPTPATLTQAAVLQPALCQAIGDTRCSAVTVQEVATLLIKEQLNSYGLLAPLQHQQSTDDTRVLRGSGIYPTCALINHECIPNVARFEAFDACIDNKWPAQWPGRDSKTQGLVVQQLPTLQQQQCGSCSCASSSGNSSSSTLMVMRALHGLPAGTEIVQSYFPLNWRLQERQQQAQEVYGFTCTCPRCLLESSPEWQADDESSGEWETDSAADDANMEAEEPAETLASQPQQQAQHAQQRQECLDVAGSTSCVTAEVASSSSQQQPQQQELDSTYLSLFLLKYMCPREGCYGTMAALQGTNKLECSVCGHMRTEAEFLAELE